MDNLESGKLMGMKFTEEQQKVIDTRGRNLLVSAAAGSGKTAVLVERIIQMITDVEAPTPVSDLLVVTFTNAAAAEMRERIGTALYQQIEDKPADAYLQQQLTLLPSAHIMTLHAFCLKVIRNHFYRIDLDPGFGIGDEADLTLMCQEVMEEVMEAYFEEGEADFLSLVEGYASGKSDKALEELVMSIYRMSQSHPTPELWLEESLDRIYFATLEDWLGSAYVAFIIEEVEGVLMHLEKLAQEAMGLIQEDPGLLPMGETLTSYRETMMQLSGLLSTPGDLFPALLAIELPRAKSAKRGTDKSLSEPVKYLREQIKDGLNKLAIQYGEVYDQQFIEQMGYSHRHMMALVRIVKTFMEAYTSKKLGKNLLDFNDIEHYALTILTNEDRSPSDVARLYQRAFKEILADEYQDINLVQETLISAVSKVSVGKPNIFMVGDIKQSIYKFRLAKPELFAEKYEAYEFVSSDYQKIELHKNFRSRREVIEMTNFLFTQLMSKDVGDVTYDGHTALNQGASYDLEDERYRTELVLIDKGHSQDSTPEIEAHQVAKEIQHILHMEPPLMVFDKAQDLVRKVKYKDIVILLRTMSGWSETYVNGLKDYGIPVFSNTSTGYFDTIEIQTMLNVLRLIDNPKQDIPLIAVLRSPMFKFTGDELVTLRLSEEDVDFHSALMTYWRGSIDTSELDKKVRKFVTQLQLWRHKKSEWNIYELVQQILKDTGYNDYISMTLGGSQRKSNLDMFIGLVYKYEQSSYKGLFNFINYMEKVKRQSIDYGEAKFDQDSKDQVTIMSIHGSKGLEFPVVILGGLGKSFNKMDLRQSVLLNQDYGFGTDRVLVEERQKLTSPTKEVIKRVMERELMSEELRILYVALTRAREKLIFIGTVKNIPKEVEKWAKRIRTSALSLDAMTVRSAGSFLDWIMYGLMRHHGTEALLMHTETRGVSSFELGEIAPALAIREVMVDHEGEAMTEQVTLEISEEQVVDQKQLEATMSWRYDYESLSKLHLSQSVSELKRLESEETVYLGPAMEKPSYRPVFVTGEQPLTGAEKGTVFHKVMDHIDFTIPPENQDIEGLLDTMVKDQVMTEKERQTVKAQGVKNFLASVIGRRVHEAGMRGAAFKEKPFVMGIPTSEVTATDAEDFIMIQGVIDLHFEDGDGLVIVDYKTDYAKDIEDQVFVDRYKSQMGYYKRALEQQSGKKVKEIWLYTVSNGRAIPVPVG